MVKISECHTFRLPILNHIERNYFFCIVSNLIHKDSSRTWSLPIYDLSIPWYEDTNFLRHTDIHSILDSIGSTLQHFLWEEILTQKLKLISYLSGLWPANNNLSGRTGFCSLFPEMYLLCWKLGGDNDTKLSISYSQLLGA